MEPLEYRIKRRNYNFEFSDVDVSKSLEIFNVFGEVVKLVVIIPEWINASTAQISMTNGGGREIFITSVLEHNKEYDITLCRNECVSVGDQCNWKATLSVNPGGSGGILQLITYTAG